LNEEFIVTHIIENEERGLVEKLNHIIRENFILFYSPLISNFSLSNDFVGTSQFIKLKDAIDDVKSLASSKEGTFSRTNCKKALVCSPQLYPSS
jgi:hypothetical protein